MWESDSRIRISDICDPAVWGESHSKLRAKHCEETVVCVGGVVVARGSWPWREKSSVC